MRESPRPAAATTHGDASRWDRCCWHGEMTQSSMPGPVQKMVLLGAEKGPGVPVRHWRPERNAGVMIPRSPCRRRMGETFIGCRGRPDKPHIGTGRSVTQKNRSCTGRTTERGTETGLTGCREAVITNVARFRAPADILCQGGGIGDVHGQAAGRKRSRERRGVTGREGIANRQ